MIHCVLYGHFKLSNNVFVVGCGLCVVSMFDYIMNIMSHNIIINMLTPLLNSNTLSQLMSR